MTDSLGNTLESPTAPAPLSGLALAPAAEPVTKKTYRKPFLKRYGVLRSVVGSTIKWIPRY